MAFCKNCGKEIPEGGVCDCVNNAAAPVNEESNPFGGNQNDVMNGGFDDVAKKAKNNLPIIIAACVGILVVILLIVFICGHTGAKGCANKFAKTLSSKKGGKSYYSVTLPKDVIKQLKDDDEYDEMIEDFNDDMEDSLEDFKIKVKSVKKGKKLKNKALKGAESYFEKFYDKYDVDYDEIEVKKGYEFKIKVQTIDKEEDDKDTETRKISVVKLKGDGWKVVPFDSDYLEKMGNKSKND